MDQFLERLPRPLQLALIFTYVYGKLFFSKVFALDWKFIAKCLTALAGLSIVARQMPAVVGALPGVRLDATPAGIGLVMAIALALLCATGFFYVLFRFLSVIIAMDAQIAREFALARQPLAQMMRGGIPVKENPGGFIPYDEAEQSAIEEIDRLKAEHKLTDEEYQKLKEFGVGADV